jgi:hypothetical protein
MSTFGVVLGFLIIVMLGGTWLYCTWKQKQHPGKILAVILGVLAMVLILHDDLKTLVAEMPGFKVELAFDKTTEIFENYVKLVAALEKIAPPGKKEKLASLYKDLQTEKIPPKATLSTEEMVNLIIKYSEISSGTTETLLDALGRPLLDGEGKPLQTGGNKR